MKAGTASEIELGRMAYIPLACREVCQRHTLKLGDAVAWTWQSAERLYAVGFVGKSAKPALFASFKSADVRRSNIAQMFANAAAAAKAKTAAQESKCAARAHPLGLAVGDVLVCSWGYDQTNIDYYQVTRLVGTQMVEAREIGAQSIATASMQGESVPAPGNFIGPAKRYRVSGYGNRDSIRISSYSSATKMQHTEIAGMRIYGAQSWTAYA